MSSIQQIKNNMTIKSVFNLLEEAQAHPKIIENNTMIEAVTVCHHGNKRKLYYYQDGKNFVCYTNCGSMQIVDFAMKLFNCDFNKAIRILEKKFNVSNFNVGNFVDESNIELNENIDIPSIDVARTLNKGSDVPEIEIPPIDKNIINSFYDIYPSSWLKEGISKESMNKYHIKFDVLNHRIIIPAFRSDGELIGIRCRDIDENRLRNGGSKYYPIFFNGKVLRWPTGSSLYGLDISKDSIKKNKKVILFEGEKSVLKLDRYLGENNIGLALYGSNFTRIQKNTILDLGVDEIVIALDKEFEKVYDENSKLYAKKIGSMVKDIKMRCKVSVLWDKKGQLDYKDSPIDKGIEVFNDLVHNRIFL